jgi:hypothetical protein
MKIKPKWAGLFFLLALAIFNSAQLFGSETDLFPFIDIPIFSNGYEIEKENDHRSKIKSVSYLVQVKFPAAEVIEFYDAYFNAKGWRPSFEICQRHWDRSADGTKTKNLAGTHLFTSWEHPEFKLSAVLRLEYSLGDGSLVDVLVVRCELSRKSDPIRPG